MHSPKIGGMTRRPLRVSIPRSELLDTPAFTLLQKFGSDGSDEKGMHRPERL